MRDILVIRFGSLGDLCLLGWSLADLSDGNGPARQRVTLVTKAAFAPLMSEMHGVDAVESLTGSRPADVSALAVRLRRGEWDHVLDAHNVLRSNLLLGLMGRRPRARLAKDTPARLGLLVRGRLGRTGRSSGPRLERTMGDRFDAVTALARTRAIATLAAERRPPLAHLAPGRRTDAPLGLAPGAQWDTKRWPDAAWADLVRRLRGESERPIRIFLGPREASWFPGGQLARTVTDLPGINILQDLPLVDVARRLAECRTVVTNDSGLLHLAEATGTPVLAFFGPTVREFGYFPRLPGSRVLETPLECRPCSRNGKRPCHRRDLACLTGIEPTTALEALRALENAP